MILSVSQVTFVQYRGQNVLHINRGGTKRYLIFLPSFDQKWLRSLQTGQHRVWTGANISTLKRRRECPCVLVGKLFSVMAMIRFWAQRFSSNIHEHNPGKQSPKLTFQRALMFSQFVFPMAHVPVTRHYKGSHQGWIWRHLVRLWSCNPNELTVLFIL